jgi:hypothetical protein
MDQQVSMKQNEVTKYYLDGASDNSQELKICLPSNGRQYATNLQ